MINPAKYPYLSHWYEFNFDNYDSTTSQFQNLQTAFDQDDYRPVYDDGASGDPTFTTLGEREGIALDNDAYLSCRSLLLGELTVLAVIEHTIDSGTQRIGLCGASDDTAPDANWAVFAINGRFDHRNGSSGLVQGPDFDGVSGPRLLKAVIDSDTRKLGIAADGDDIVYGTQIDRASYYAQTSPGLWIGNANWSNIVETFRGTLLAFYAGPVNMAAHHPDDLVSLQAEIAAYWGTPA